MNQIVCRSFVRSRGVFVQTAYYKLNVFSYAIQLSKNARQLYFYLPMKDHKRLWAFINKQINWIPHVTSYRNMGKMITSNQNSSLLQ